MSIASLSQNYVFVPFTKSIKLFIFLHFYWHLASLGHHHLLLELPSDWAKPGAKPSAVAGSGWLTWSLPAPWRAGGGGNRSPVEVGCSTRNTRVGLSTGCQKGRSGINRHHQVRDWLGDRYLRETSTKAVNRFFAEENIRTANQHVKRCLTSRVVRTMFMKSQ